MPLAGPLVLIGENNAGKSNLTRPVEILFGERWPGTVNLEDHDFHGRDPDGVEVAIQAEVDGVSCPYCGQQVSFIGWRYDRQAEAGPVSYSFACSAPYCRKTFPKRELADAITQIRMDADRRLSYQLSYSSKYTLLSKMMHKFHERLTNDADRSRALEAIFSDLMGEFGQVVEFQRFRELLGETAADFGMNLAYRLDIDFSAYDPSNFFRSLRVHPKLGEEIRSFDELGTGQEQILALAFWYAYARAFAEIEGLIIVIDEPEAHLHPAAQQWLASRVAKMHEDGIQTIITSHSPHFVDLAHIQNLVLVRKTADLVTYTRQLDSQALVNELVRRGADPERTTVEAVGEFYATAATTDIKNALFSRACVLVEGATEAFAFPELLRKVGFDVLRLGISFVAVGGASNLARWQRFFAIYGIPVYCVFDTDRDKRGSEAAAAERTRRDLAVAIMGDAQVFDVDRLSRQPIEVRASYTTVEPTFEPAMAKLLGADWTTLYEAAKDLVGASKPLRARYAAQRVNLDDLGEAKQVLHRLATSLGLLVQPG